MLKRLLVFVLLSAAVAFAGQKRVYAVVHLYQKMVVGGLNPPAGVFYTTDGGDKWEHIGWTNIIAYSLTIDPGSNGKIMYLAAGNGVLKSTDSGETWRIMTDWHETEVSQVVIDPGNHNILYIATPYGVFKSTDAGWTWSKKNNGISPEQTGTTSSTFIGPIIIDKANPDRILIGTENGIYMSTNGAESWKLFALKGEGVRDLATNAANPKLMIAGTENAGIFTSRDGGRTWSHPGDGIDTLAIYTVGFDPHDENVMYAGGYDTGFMKSTDGGKTWQTFSSGLTEKTLHGIAVDPDNTQDIYVATIPGGVFKSVDGGKTWKYLFLDGAQVWSVMIH
jgi:photosystem II stability/assembly factor-like uncharacterized protein